MWKLLKDGMSVVISNHARSGFLREILYENIAIIAIQHSKLYFVDTFGDFCHSVKSMWNIAVGIKNCKQLFSLRVALTTQKKATRATEMMSVEGVVIFWVVNASSGEKSCLQFSIPTGSGAGGKGGVSHSLKWNSLKSVWKMSLYILA